MARFIGGPCGGQTAPSPPQPFRDCGGATYALLQDGDYHFIGTPADGGTDYSLNTKQVTGAWSRFTRALGVDGPRAIRRSKASRKRLGRIVR